MAIDDKIKTIGEFQESQNKLLTEKYNLSVDKLIDILAALNDKFSNLNSYSKINLIAYIDKASNEIDKRFIDVTSYHQHIRQFKVSKLINSSGYFSKNNLDETTKEKILKICLEPYREEVMRVISTRGFYMEIAEELGILPEYFSQLKQAILRGKPFMSYRGIKFVHWLVENGYEVGLPRLIKD